MSIPSPIPPDVLGLLVFAFGAGTLTQLARQLAQPTPLSLRRTLALGVLAGIAALSVVALLTATMSPAPAQALLLAAACISGWSGPSLLGRLGSVVERRLGLTTSFFEAPNATETTAISPAEKSK